MTTTLILTGPSLDAAAARNLAQTLGGTAEQRNGHARVTTGRTLDRQAVMALREGHDFDINPAPAGFDGAAARLLISDMDSTLINIECMDEIADHLGIKSQVAEVTEAAMRGEIDFETSLRKRIALVRGIGTEVLQHVYDDRLRLNPGAEALLAGLRARGIRTALVSGGFTFYTGRLRERLGLDYTLANELDLDADGRISGEVPGAIVGAQAKADFLQRLCAELAIEPRQVIAVGDGANDLPMLRLAGLSVAYRAKPAVQAEVAIALNHSGLDAILAFLD